MFYAQISTIFDERFDGRHCDALAALAGGDARVQHLDHSPPAPAAAPGHGIGSRDTMDFIDP